MSTDTDSIAPWEGLAESELDELIRRVDVIRGTKDTDRAFHAFMVGILIANLRTINRALQEVGESILQDAARQA